MKIILTEAVENLGQAGDMKEVANGYARNFLFPRNLAIPATKGAVQDVANRRATAARRAAVQQNAAQTLADRLRGLQVLLYARTGDQNRLYGSITAADVAEALRVQHHQTVDRRRIRIDTPIHRTGRYTATVTVGQNLTAPITLLVEPETSRGAALTSVAATAPAPPPAPPAAAPVVAETPVEPVGVAEAPAAAPIAVETPAEPVVAEAAPAPAVAEAPAEPAVAAEAPGEPAVAEAPVAPTAAEAEPVADVEADGEPVEAAPETLVVVPTSVTDAESAAPAAGTESGA